MGESRQSVATLQTQLEDYRERSRKDIVEAQRNCKDRLAELQRAQNNLKAQQEEVRTNGIEKGKDKTLHMYVYYYMYLPFYSHSRRTD